jgi:anti-sigma-K factor RskA
VLAELRGKLLAEDPEAVTVAWKKAGEDPALVAGEADLESVAGLGDVVWSSARQQGYMRFRGLAANDPNVAQYQLWIFDAERDEAYPVDGGVFDVPAAGGDVVVRIDPRLRVSRATAFAITVERPGGVVVSSRKRLPLLATVP